MIGMQYQYLHTTTTYPRCEYLTISTRTTLTGKWAYKYDNFEGGVS